jgi:fibronectin type 3 domain-containing protein
MKISKRIISTALATLMVGSTLAVGAISASAASVKKPTKVTAKNSQKTIAVSWKKVAGATKYKVYVGKKAVKTTKKTSFKYHGVYAGKKYTFTVKAYKGKKASKASTAVKVMRMNAPTIRTVVNQKNSVKITWTKKKGATSYQIYKKSGSGSYKKIATTAKTSYIDKDVTSATKYSYKLVSYNKTTKAVSVKSGKRSTIFLQRPKNLVALESEAKDAINLTWNASESATAYNVYRLSADNEKWVKIASNVAATEYTDAMTSKNPRAFIYKVTAVKDSWKSADSDERGTAFVPKRVDGVNRYYFDKNNDPHVTIYLSAGEKYAEGKFVADFFDAQGLFKAEVAEGADVATVSADGVITAVKSGKAVIKVTADDIITKYAADHNRAMDFGFQVNEFDPLRLASIVNNTLFVEVEVG